MKPSFWQHFEQIIQLRPQSRPWHMPIMAGIATSLPVFIGAFFGQLTYGLIASLGSMVFLNLPYQGRFLFRMTQVLACSFGFVGCFILGALVHLLPILTVPVLMFMTFWIALFSRYFRLAPPAGLFILMASAIAMFLPMPISLLPFYTGLIAIGCLFSGMLASFYTLLIMYGRDNTANIEPFAYQSDMLVDSLIVALTVSISMAIAMLFNMPKPYWVPVSCYVVITGINFYSMWIKQIQRTLGTAVGMIVAWGLLSLGLNAWGVAVFMFLLLTMIEKMVVRNYVIAVIFITPLTILMAEYSTQHTDTVNAVSHSAIILTRFWDTVVGCLIGVLGGMVMHAKSLRPKLQQFDKWAMTKFQTS